jgi:hypothetical protein
MESMGSGTKKYKQHHLRTFVFLGGFILFCVCEGFPQDQKLSYAEVDETTYLLYSQQNWDSLVSYGKYAMHQGHDFFYLRLRMGIAFFHKENYMLAIQQLNKADKLNKNNPTVKEYLYYSYRYSNQKLQAKNLDFITFEQATTGNKKNIESINLETGPILSNNVKNNKADKLIVPENGEEYGEQDLNDWKYYTQFGTSFYLGKSVSMYLGYNNLQIFKLKQLAYLDIENPGLPPMVQVRSYEDQYTLHQNGLYANASFLLNKGFILTPALHYLNVKYQTIYLQVPGSGAANQALKVVYRTTQINNIVAYVGFGKSFSFFKAGLFGSYSNLNDLEQYQGGASFSWFPEGNLDLYFTSKLTSCWEDNNNRLVFDQLLGFKVLPELWIESSVTFGQLLNYNENNAFVIYNSGDQINARFTANIIVPLNEKIELSCRYNFVKFESNWISLGQLGTDIINTEYNNHLILGGITWTL